jgi:hypothetical protein
MTLDPTGPILVRKTEKRLVRKRIDDAAISADYVRRALDYDPTTGVFIWRAPSRKDVIGKQAGKRRRDGYVVLSFWSRYYLAHRVAWLYVYGRWPENCIDHINGEPSDNRIANLREATHAENIANRPKQSNNRSGRKGVAFHARSGRWVAQIAKNGAKHHLGYFKTRDLAAEAYAKAARDLHGDFARVE